MHSLALARSFLFVPGNRPERFGKAVASGADAVILDLEDSVPPSEKVAARAAIVEALPALAGGGVPLLLRIASPREEAGQADLAGLGMARGLAGVMVAKAETREELQAVAQRAPTLALLPLVETARGCHALAVLAAAPAVLRLALGHIDLMADLGLRYSDDERELDGLRFAFTLQSRLHGLAPPVDGVTTCLEDAERLRVDTLRAVRLGFGAKLCVHPRQVDGVHEALRPSPQELAQAQRVLAADAQAGGAALRLDGAMVDAPVVLAARRIVQRAAGAPAATPLPQKQVVR